MALRPYQESALHDVGAHFAAGARSVCLVVPTGGGKSIIATSWLTGDSGIRNAPRRHDDTGLFLVHRDQLREQAFEHLERVLPGEIGMIGPRANPNPDGRIQVATIQTLLARRELPDVKRIIADEAHHFAADEWRPLLDAYPDARILGLTATPERRDGRPLGDIFEQLVVGARYPELVADGHLVRCRAFAPPQAVEGGVANDPVEIYQRYGENSTGFLFADSIPNAELWAERFSEAGIPAAAVHQRTPKRDRDRVLDAFRAGQLRILTNVYCLDADTEILTSDGWASINVMTSSHNVANWDDGRIWFEPPTAIIRRNRLPDERMVYLDSRRKNIRVTEQHRMLYRTNRQGKFKHALARDLVNRSVQLPISGIAEPQLIQLPQRDTQSKAARSRRIASNAYSLRERLGIGHAESLALTKERVAIADGMRHKNPHELSVDECWLIGFWLGDGTRTALKSGGLEYVITQSTSSPGVIRAIDRVLGRLDLDVLRKQRPGRAANNASPFVKWSFSRGTGHGPQKRRGLFAIEPYLDKDGSPLWWGFSIPQFDAFLDGFWHADGNHGVDPDAVRPAGYWISNHNKKLLSMIQAIATCRGYRTTICKGMAPIKRHHSQMWLLTFRKASSYGINRAVGTPLVIETDEWKRERVWCVSTTSGNIVTRRRGTVTVMGNCFTEGTDVPAARVCILARPASHVSAYLQMAGRVLRPSPGKPDAIILDLCGSVLEHGLPTEDRTYSLEGRAISRTVASVRQCPQCGAVHDGAPATCDLCGYTFPVAAEQPVRPPRIYDLELREVYAAEATPDDAKRREFDRLVAYAEARDWSLSWVVKQYALLFKEPPTALLAELPEDVRRREYDKLAALQRERGHKPGFPAARYKEMFGAWPARAWSQPVAPPAPKLPAFIPWLTAQPHGLAQKVLDCTRSGCLQARLERADRSVSEAAVLADHLGTDHDDEYAEIELGDAIEEYKRAFVPGYVPVQATGTDDDVPF